MSSRAGYEGVSVRHLLGEICFNKRCGARRGDTLQSTAEVMTVTFRGENPPCGYGNDLKEKIVEESVRCTETTV